MSEYKKFKQSIENEKKNYENGIEISNPLLQRKSPNSIALTNYTQEIKRKSVDEELCNIIEVVKLLNNLAPLCMPIYNFNPSEINGEHFYKPDGTLLLIREFDRQVVRDYYVSVNPNTKQETIDRILEHDKLTGRLKAKIVPIERSSSSVNTSITIFDDKINNKYTIMQLSQDGFVSNISEFSGVGKSFQTLFRSIETMKPVRYLEGKDIPDEGFIMLDCLFDSQGKIVKMRKYNNNREENIDYTKNTKNVSVKTKSIE